LRVDLPATSVEHSARATFVRLQRSTHLLRSTATITKSQMAAHENSAKPGTAKAGLDVARNGWFTELSTMWKGQGLSFQVEKTLFQDRSKFQVCYSSMFHNIQAFFSTHAVFLTWTSGACRMSAYFRPRLLAKYWCWMVCMLPLACAHHLHQCVYTDKWGLHMTGVIQCSEKDEFAYQEMIAHLPLCGLAVRAGFQCCALVCFVYVTHCREG